MTESQKILWKELVQLRNAGLIPLLKLSLSKSNWEVGRFLPMCLVPILRENLELVFEVVKMQCVRQAA